VSLRRVLTFTFAILMAPSLAVAQIGKLDEDTLSLAGNLRSILGFNFNYDEPLLFGPDNRADGFSQTLLRLTLDAAHDPGFSYQFHAVQSGTVANFQQSSADNPFNLVQATTRYRLLDLNWEQYQADDVQFSLFIDRAWIRYQNEYVDIVVGRQAIAFATALLWSPMDVFLPFDPRQFDQEYKPGVDAIRVDVPIELTSGITLVGSPGRTLATTGASVPSGFGGATWFGTAIMLRAFSSFGGWDVNLQGGKVYGGYQVATGFVGETSPVQYRGELTFTVASPTTAGSIEDGQVDTAPSASVGLGLALANGLDLGLDYFYNGQAADDLFESALRLATGGTLTLSAHQIGLFANYLALPILSVGGLFIVSASDGSVQIQPIVVYSISDESEFLVGASVNIGRRPTGQDPVTGLPVFRSEYGTYPQTVFAEYKFYF
jgi:hypothetical protein